MEDMAEGLRYPGKPVASLRGCAFFGVRSWGYQWARDAELPQVSDSRDRPRGMAGQFGNEKGRAGVSDIVVSGGDMHVFGNEGAIFLLQGITWRLHRCKKTSQLRLGEL